MQRDTDWARCARSRIRKSKGREHSWGSKYRVVGVGVGVWLYACSRWWRRENPCTESGSETPGQTLPTGNHGCDWYILLGSYPPYNLISRTMREREVSPLGEADGRRQVERKH